MNKPSLNFTDITQYVNRLDLIQAAANQIIKDFEMFGIEIKFSGNAYNAYEELFNQIQPHIENLMKTNQTKFMGIIYRIDISDTQIKKTLSENNSEPFAVVITDLIIKRELQKVVIRQHYKNATDEK